MSHPASTRLVALVVTAIAIVASVAEAQDPIATPYDPPWADVQPTNVLSIDFDPAKSGADNANDLLLLIQSLVPGDRLEIGGGVWDFNQIFNVNLQGTRQAPIWIVAKDGETPVITGTSPRRCRR